MNISEATVLAIQLMTQWGLREPGGQFYSLGWFDSVRTLGRCSDARRLIQLNRTFVLNATSEQVAEVMKHEIAHAKAGCKNGHNRVWKMWARVVGCKPVACVSEAVMIPAKYAALCDTHGILRSFKRRVDLSKKICRKCKGKIELLPWHEARRRQERRVTND